MPEIEATASTSIYRDMKFRMGDNEQEVVMATADSVFMNFFQYTAAERNSQLPERK